jgi:hypothetical protein
MNEVMEYISDAISTSVPTGPAVESLREGHAKLVF